MNLFKAWWEYDARNHDYIVVRYYDGTRLPSGRLKQFNEHRFHKSTTMDVNGQRFNGKALAEELVAQCYNKHWMGLSGKFDLTPAVEPLKEKFIEHLETNRHSECDIKHVEVSLRRLMEEAHVVTLSDLYRQDLFLDWKKKMVDLETETIRGRLADVRRFVTWLIREKYVGSTPFVEGTIPPREDKDVRLWTAEQFLDFDDAIRQICPYTRLGATLARDMGLRKVEIVGNAEQTRLGVLFENMVWNDDGTADLVLPKKTVKRVKKKNRGRIIPISPAVLEQLGLRKGSGPLVPITRYEFDHRFRAGLKKAGLDTLEPSLTIHGLRHAFSTYSQEYGKNLGATQEMLGHSELATTQIYTHTRSAAVREVAMTTYRRRVQDEALIRQQRSQVA